jgi:hypothetical protein
VPTVAQCKKLFQDQVAPSADATFLRILNEADIRILSQGEWRWTRGRTTLTPVDGIITLPNTYASILGAQVNGYAEDIHDEQFEFVPQGVGEVKVGGGGTVRLIDQGFGEDNVRTYKVVGHIQPDWTVYCLCHLAPVMLYDPAIDDSDVPPEATTNTRCPDPYALKLFCIGIVYEEASDMGSASIYMNKAIKVLNDKENQDRGSSRQSLTIRPNGPGNRRIRHLR